MVTQTRTRTDPAWAWAAYVPDAQSPWTPRLAGHLFRRAAFGANAGQIQQAVADGGPGPSIDRLLRPGAAAESFNRTFDGYEQHAIDPGAETVEVLREWWLRRMMQSPHPLLETMTLFWHDHFAVSNSRVKSGWLTAHHVSLLRANALGRLDPLFTALVRDPALMLSHGAPANRKAAPEPGLARAWLDRFTLGPNQATDRDVRETARAFTGRFVLRNQYRDLAYEHDGGRKTVVGTEGNWTDADIVRITLSKPETARHITRRVYRWFVTDAEEPTDALLAPLADRLASDGDIGRLVETVLRSNLFFSPAAYRRQIKSPVTLAIGIARALEGVVPTTPLGNDLADLGQNLGQPPSSNGWASGTAWVNRATTIGRINLSAALMAGDAPYAGKLDPVATARLHGQSPGQAGRFLVNLLLQDDLPDDVKTLVLEPMAASKGDPARGVRGVAYALAALPEFQLA
jgi:uncharacterized protein (DUF1800 family)